MIPASFEYKRAGSVADAIALLKADPNAKILAGGHSLIPAMKLRLSQPSSLIEEARNHFGHLDALINNASTFVRDDVKTTTKESWDANVRINLEAPFWISQEFFKTVGQGCIINMLDQRVWNLTPYFASYTMAKSALWSLTRQWALAMAPHVRVNAIGPGPTLPDKYQTQDDFKRHTMQVPLKMATPLDDIARGVDFILNTPSFTGQMLALDGGQHLGWAFPNVQHAMED